MGVRIRHSKPTSPLYAAYPFFFKAAFPGLSVDQMFDLSLGLRLISDYVSVTDGLIDVVEPDAVATEALTVQGLQFEAMARLQRLFSPESRFWERYRDLSAKTAAACLRERELSVPFTQWAESSRAEVRSIASRKGALAQLVPVGLAELTGDLGPEPELVESVMRCQLGVQLMDDLQDWKRDLCNGVPSTVAFEVGLRLGSRGTGSIRLDAIDDIVREFYEVALWVRPLDEAEEEFRAALSISTAAGTEAWSERIDRCLSRSVALRADLEALSGRDRSELGGGHLRRSGSSIEETLLGSLLDDVQDDLHEARHRQPYPKAFDPYGLRPIQYADTYARAVVASALCTASQTFREAEPARTMLMHEISSECVRGEWSFFRDVAELRFSVDVVAERILALGAGRVGGVRIGALFSPAIEMLVSHCTRPSGACSTWYCTPSDPESLELASILGAQTEWIEALDVEVNAKLARALLRIGDPNARDLAEECASWVADQQRHDGSWCGRGTYWWPTYGTWLCIALFTELGVMMEHVEQALSFVRKTQRGDGSWGDNHDRGRVLPTAFGLRVLTLALESGMAAPGDRMRAESAAELLAARCAGDPPCPRDTMLRIAWNAYSSRVLTAAHVLTALLEWSALVDNELKGASYESADG